MFPTYPVSAGHPHICDALHASQHGGAFPGENSLVDVLRGWNDLNLFHVLDQGCSDRLQPTIPPIDHQNHSKKVPVEAKLLRKERRGRGEETLSEEGGSFPHPSSHKAREERSVPAFQSMCHTRRKSRPSDNEDGLQILSDLIVPTRRARAVEYRNVQRKLTRFQQQIDLGRRIFHRLLLLLLGGNRRLLSLPRLLGLWWLWRWLFRWNGSLVLRLLLFFLIDLHRGGCRVLSHPSFGGVYDRHVFVGFDRVT